MDGVQNKEVGDEKGTGNTTMDIENGWPANVIVWTVEMKDSTLESRTGHHRHHWKRLEQFGNRTPELRQTDRSKREIFSFLLLPLPCFK